MELSKDQIKSWLTNPGRSRDWLADKCSVRAKTVNNWLSSPIEIPAKAARIIEQLFKADEETARAANPAPPMSLVVEVDGERFDAYNRAALSEGMIIRDWAIHVMDAAASRDKAAGMLIYPSGVEVPEDQLQMRKVAEEVRAHQKEHAVTPVKYPPGKRRGKS